MGIIKFKDSEAVSSTYFILSHRVVFDPTIIQILKGVAWYSHSAFLANHKVPSSMAERCEQ